jgi:hypothetical protein
MTGKNTDFDGLESYNLATGKWRNLDGIWTIATRPATPDIGSKGWNTDLSVSERWTGVEWERD